MIFFWGGAFEGGGFGLGGQGGCKRRIEVFVKVKKNIMGGVGSGGVQGRCERRSEVV